MKHGKKLLDTNATHWEWDIYFHWYLVIYTLKISSILQSLKILSSQQQMAKQVVVQSY